MKHKRLNRDSWGFQHHPYYQMRIDDELFHGLACLIRLTDGEKNYWETTKGILHTLCADIPKTNAWCAQVRQIVEDRIADGEPIKKCRETL